jgi:hypothetical protein
LLTPESFAPDPVKPDTLWRSACPFVPNPRRHKRATHFRWEGPYLVGRTAIGRVTVALLHMNDEYRFELREMLIGEGVCPPA